MITTKQFRVASSLFLVAGAVACNPVDEHYSGACWTTVKDGRVTMRCPDGSRASWMEPKGDGHCSVSTDEEGVRTIECPDGTSARVPPTTTFPGQPSEPSGDACSLQATDNGGFSLVCGPATYAVVRDCPDGFPGAVELQGGTPGFPSIAGITYQAMVCDRIQDALYVHDGVQFPEHHALIQKLRRAGGVSVQAAALSDEARFDALEALDGMLSVDVWGSDITGSLVFPKLERVENLVLISGSGLTSNSVQLPVLERTGEVRVQWTMVLRDLTLLRSVRTMGALSIHSNASLETLEGLEGVTALDGDLNITGNDSLTSLDALSGVTSISGNIVIQNNALLPRCHASDFVATMRAQAAFTGTATLESSEDSCGD